MILAKMEKLKTYRWTETCVMRVSKCDRDGYRAIHEVVILYLDFCDCTRQSPVHHAAFRPGETINEPSLQLRPRRPCQARRYASQHHR